MLPAESPAPTGTEPAAPELRPTADSHRPEVLQAISTAIPQLQQSFAAAGMSLGQANVGADSGGRFFSKNRSTPADTVKSMTEPLESTTPSTVLKVRLGLINAFA